MKNINQAYAEMNALGCRIGDFLRITDYYNYNDLRAFDINYSDAQKFFLKAEMQAIVDRLADA